MAPAYWSPFPILRYTAKCAGTSSRPVVVPTDGSAFCRDREFESHFLQQRVTNEPSSASSDRAKAAFRMVCSRSFGNDHLIHPTVAAVAGVQRIAAIVDRPHLCRDLGVA